MNVLELRGLRRTFAKGEEALRGVDLDVAAGEVVGLLGRNGAGKTTLLRTALGLLHAQRGSTRVFGLDPRREPVQVKRRVGYVAEGQELPGWARVEEVLDLHRGLFPTWDDALAADLVRRFGLRPGPRIAELSKGEARRVALVCAVAHRPDLLLLDEPAGGLDPAARREFLEVAIERIATDGATLLFSSHHTADVERIAQRVVLLDDGQVLLDSELDLLREQATLAVLAGAGTPEALLALEGCIQARAADGRLRAVFLREPRALEAELRERLAPPELDCAPLPLEDLFVELVGWTS